MQKDTIQRQIWYCWWLKSCTSWYIGSLSPLFTRFIHSRWLFGISSINSIFVVRVFGPIIDRFFGSVRIPDHHRISFHGTLGVVKRACFENDLSWHKDVSKRVVTWWNKHEQTKQIYLYIYIIYLYIYNFISSCRNSYPSSTGFFPIRLCPFHSQS